MSTDSGTKTERDELAATELAEPTGPAVPATVADRPIVGLVGRFRLEAPLGSGGMADVYRAHDPLLDRAVALKVLRTRTRADDPQRMRRVLREARAAAALTHPNTVTIFDVGEADGAVFIAMELLEGSTLRGLLGREGITLEQKLHWLLQAARALGAAHERGLVHRDVKPDNMFVCTDGTLKLLDFGIAKRDEDDSQDSAPSSMGPSSLRTAEGRRVGTPRYMAPEQHAGEATDARTDEYAWGLVAFELLTGTRASDVALGSTPANALRAKVPELDEAIVSTVTRALEPRKDDRFPSMAPVVAAFEKRKGAASLEATARTPRRSGWVVAGVLSFAAIGILVGARSVLRDRVSVGAGTRATPEERRLLPACRVDVPRSLPIAAADRVAILPTGELVTFRDIKRGLVLTREMETGPEPFTQNRFVPLSLSAIGSDYEEISVRGIRAHGVSWVFADVKKSSLRGALLLTLSAGDEFAVRAMPVFGITGIAATSFGKDIVAGVTTSLVEGRFSGVQLFVLTDYKTQPTTVEAGGAFAPAIATSQSRIALTYLLENEGRTQLHVALLDEHAIRVGDVLTVATTTPTMLVPAVAFAGEAATIFWIDTSGARTRLTMSTVAPDRASMSSPKVAVDEPVTQQPPVTAHLPTGEWVVAWLASTGGDPMLRVSPIGPGGVLTGPTDVAKLPSFTLLRATSGDHGVELSWQENGANGAQTAKFARVTCVAPPSARP